VSDSNFNARADGAMRAVKTQMGLPSTLVPDGPPQRAPVPGSYAEQLQKDRQAQMAQPRPSMGRNTVETEEPSSDNGGVAPSNQPDKEGEVQQGEDGSVPFKDHPIYNRFAEVSREKTAYKRELEQLRKEREERDLDLAKARQEAEQLKAERQRLLEQQFETLPPEERAAVMARSEVERGIQAAEQRLVERFGPIFRTVQEDRLQREVERVAGKYPAFDFDVHMPLIQTFREQNPACSVEHAFRAVAEDHELAVNGRTARRVPPPVVVPGSPVGQRMDASSSEEKEEQHLQQGAQRLRDVASAPGAEQHSVLGTAAESIRDRYSRRWDQRGFGNPRR